jgi:hypothetical protein
VRPEGSRHREEQAVRAGLPAGGGEAVLSKRLRDRELCELIDKAFTASRETYGAPRIQAELAETSMACGSPASASRG